jgi:hypothetical protein
MKKRLVDKLYQRKNEINKRLVELNGLQDTLNLNSENNNKELIQLNVLEKEVELLRLEWQQIEQYLEIILSIPF